MRFIVLQFTEQALKKAKHNVIHVHSTMIDGEYDQYQII